MKHMNGQERIETMFAYIVVDDDNTEGVPTLNMGTLAMPLVGADDAAMEALRPHAQAIADQTGKAVTLAKFSVRTEEEVLQPSQALKAFRKP